MDTVILNKNVISDIFNLNILCHLYIVPGV